MEKRSLALRIVVVLVAILSIGGVYWIKNQPKTKQDKTPPIEEEKIYTANFYLDSDGDGLYDWEEILWGTDPYNPDTDGDGTPDGEEVKLGRDPRAPGPDDILKPEDMPIYLRDDVENLSAFELLYKETVNRVADLAKEGDVPRSTVEKIVSDLSGEIFLKTELRKKYQPSEILISTDNNKESVKEYVNLISQVSQVYDFNLSNEEVLDIVINTISAERDPEINAKTSRLIEDLKKTELSMSIITVPSDLLAEHAALLNSLYSIHSGLEQALNPTTDDVMERFSALNTLIAGLDLLTLSSFEIQDVIESLNIKFDPNEPGASFSKESGTI